MITPQNIEWRAPDFRRVARRDIWQSASLFVAFVLGIAAFLKRSIPFFIVVIVLECVALIGTKRVRHTEEDYQLDDEGLWIANELVYPRTAVDRFALADYGEEKIVPYSELVIISHVFRPSTRRMLIPHERGADARAYLTNSWGIAEFEYRLGAKEFFMRLFGM